MFPMAEISSRFQQNANHYVTKSLFQGFFWLLLLLLLLFPTIAAFYWNRESTRNSIHSWKYGPKSVHVSTIGCQMTCDMNFGRNKATIDTIKQVWNAIKCWERRGVEWRRVGRGRCSLKKFRCFEVKINLIFLGDKLLHFLQDISWIIVKFGKVFRFSQEKSCKNL